MSYRILEPADVPAYIAGYPVLKRWGEVTDVAELSGGYLNHVFRVSCANGSLVLKQSMPYVRVDQSWALTPTRILHEAHSYDTWRTFAPSLVPDLYLVDPERFIIVVEDLADHLVWRQALSQGDVHPHAARDLGRFIASVAVNTREVSRTAHERQPARALADNNAVMAQLMSDVIFEFPYVDHSHNSFPEKALPQVAELRSDPQYRASVSALRTRWSDTHEALIHGDLHTGSVMVAAQSTRVIDSEFSLHGPVAWDLGALLGNLLLALIRSHVLTGAGNEHLDSLPQAMWDSFEDELVATSSGEAGSAFSTSWIERIRADAIGFAGLEMVRRIIGSGKAGDLTTLPEEQYAIAACATLATGRQLVLDRESLTPAESMDVVRAAAGVLRA